MRNVFLISANTLRETLRQKLMILVALVALALVLSSKYLLSLDLGHEQLRFVFDFGSGALGFFGSIIAVVATCQIFHSELENKTVITLLSKPAVCGWKVSGRGGGSRAFRRSNRGGDVPYAFHHAGGFRRGGGATFGRA